MPKQTRLLYYLVATVIFLLFIITISGNLNNIPGISLIYPSETGNYIIGQNFSIEDAARIISISSNDIYVTDALRSSPAHSNGGGFIVSCVTTASFLDIAPDVNNGSMLILPIYRVLPVVVYDIGDPACSGEKLFAYVDPGREYVPYLGYAVRGGKPGNWSYTSIGDGVRAIKKDPMDPSLLAGFSETKNLSIADTDIVLAENISEQYKDRLYEIALNDSRVSGYLKGYDYVIDRIRILGLVGRNLWGAYLMDYPTLDFLVMYRGQWVPFMGVTIDPQRNEIVHIMPYSSEPAGNVSYYSKYK